MVRALALSKAGHGRGDVLDHCRKGFAVRGERREFGCESEELGESVETPLGGTDGTMGRRPRCGLTENLLEASFDQLSGREERTERWSGWSVILVMGCQSCVAGKLDDREIMPGD